MPIFREWRQTCHMCLHVCVCVLCVAAWTVAWTVALDILKLIELCFSVHVCDKSYEQAEWCGDGPNGTAAPSQSAPSEHFGVDSKTIGVYLG